MALEFKLENQQDDSGDGDTRGIDNGNRGQGSDNTGKSIKEYRVGRGPR